MIAMRTVLFLATLSSGVIGQDDDRDASSGVLRLEGEDVVLKVSEGQRLSFESLLRFTHEQTGASFLYDEAEIFGRHAPFIGEYRVARESCFELAQALLAQSGFACLEVPSSSGRLFQLLSKRDARRGDITSMAKYVPTAQVLAEASDWSRRPGQFITTAIALDNLDARQIFSSLRVYFTDQIIEKIAPSDNANSLVITGSAPKIVEFATLLRDLDRQGAGAFRRFETGEIPPSQAVALVRSYLDQLNDVDPEEKKRGPAPDQRDRVAVMLAPNENAIIVYAVPSALDRIAELLEQTR